MASIVQPIFVLILLFLSPFAHAQQELQCDIPGECVGVLISVTEASNSGECVFLCKHVTSCAWYTFYPTDNLCTLHEQCGVVSEDCDDCMSGQDTCPACNVRGECEGVNFHLEPDVEEQQCLELCEDSELCYYYSYSQDDHYCLLFTSCPSLTLMPCPSCVTGQPGCTLGEEEPSTSTSSVGPSTTTPSVETTTEAGAYIIVLSGSTCERVTSKEECQEAARQLGLSDTTANEEAEYNYPPYCYFYDGFSLYFNKQLNSETVCSPDNACICKKAI